MNNFQEINIGQGGSGNIQNNTFNFANQQRNGPIPSNIRQGSKNFVGREDELKRIHAILETGQGVVVCAVEGMGGVGKSELALQYADHYKTDYKERYWLSLRDSTLAEEVVKLASKAISLPETMQAAGLEEQAEWYWQNWLPAEGKLLIILDDVPDAASVPDRAMPLDSRFRVLLTTRERSLNIGFESVPLNVLSPAQAMELLEKIVGKTRRENESSIVKQICKYLGYLPLGVELVGEYLQKYRHLTFTELQQRLSLADESLNRERPGKLYGYRGVAAALKLSWDDLSVASQRVAMLLGLFAPVEIQWSLVEQIAEQANLTATELNEARGQLDNLHLIQPVDQECNFYRIHSLVREFFLGELAQQSELNSTYRTAFVTRLLETAKQIPQSPTRHLIERVTPAIPHLDLISQEMLDDIPNPEDNLFLAFEGLGRYFLFQGLYKLAEELFQNCVKETTERLGSAHLQTATSFNSLANYYKFQGRYSEAESLLKQALSILNQYAPNELLAAAILNNLAEVYKEQGRYAEAESLYLQSLSVREQKLGKDHIDVALSLNNLAEVYLKQGQYNKAELYYLQSISIYRRELEGNHPILALSYSNLANLYLEQGRYKEAEPLYQEAIAIDESCFGENNHQVAIDLHNLAALRRKQQRYNEAENLLKRSLEIDKKNLGSEHLCVASTLNDLAGLYRVQKRYRQSEEYYKRSLTIRENSLESNHLDVSASLNNLATLYDDQRRYKESEPLYLRALSIKEQWLESDHPSIATTLNNLAECYYLQGRLEEAKAMFHRALNILESKRGVTHPDTIVVKANLARVQRKKIGKQQSSKGFRKVNGIEIAKKKRS